MDIVVTGSNGLIGSRLASLLGARGHTVRGFGRGARRSKGDFDYVACDLGNEAEVLAAFERLRPDVIIHTASMTEVDACEKDRAQAFSTNVLASCFLARVAAERGSHLLHVSTDYVFDGEEGPYDERAVPNPRGVYAVTKHMGEQAVQTLAASWAVARTAVVYGWPAAGRANFGAWLVGALSQAKEVKLFSDQFVSPSLADNVAEQLAELAERKLPGFWNVSGADVVTRVAYGEALCSVFGFDSKLLIPTRLSDLKLASPRPLKSGLKVEKARDHLSAKPLGLDESLRRFHQAWLKAGGNT